MKTSQPRKIICILRALAAQPSAFRSAVLNLNSEDLNDVYALVIELGQIDNVDVSTSADILASWCAQELIRKVQRTPAQVGASK
jgi:hypothetical protein